MRSRRFGAERDGGQGVGAEVEGQDLQHTEREGEVSARERPHGERGELGDVVGQVIGEESADVDVGGATLFDAGDDAREVVVEQDEVGGLPRDVGTAAAHRDPDVGLVQCRSVVDAVAGHRHDVPTVAKGAGDAELRLGGHAGDDDSVAVEQRAKHGVVVGQLVTRDDDALVAEQADPFGDRCRRRRMVPREHGHLHAGSTAVPECLVDPLAGRVDQRQQPAQLQVGLGVVAVDPVVRCPRLGCDREHSQAPGRERLERGPRSVVVTAHRQHRIRSSLDDDGVADDRAGGSATGVEGEPRHGRVPEARRPGVGADASGEGVDRRVHRFAVGRPHAVVVDGGESGRRQDGDPSHPSNRRRRLGR